jgi:hypothetical protein
VSRVRALSLVGTFFILKQTRPFSIPKHGKTSITETGDAHLLSISRLDLRLSFPNIPPRVPTRPHPGAAAGWVSRRVAGNPVKAFLI